MPRILAEVRDTVSKEDLEAVIDAYDRVAELEFSYSHPPDVEDGEVPSDRHEEIVKRAAKELDLDVDTFKQRWSVATLPFVAWDALEHVEETDVDYAKLRLIAAFELPAELAEHAVELAAKEKLTLEKLHEKVKALAEDNLAAQGDTSGV